MQPSTVREVVSRWVNGYGRNIEIYSYSQRWAGMLLNRGETEGKLKVRLSTRTLVRTRESDR